MHTELWIGWGELEQGTRRSENTPRKLEAAGAPIFRLGGTPCMRPEAWTEFLHKAESKAGSAGSEYQAAKAAADNLQKAVAAASDRIQKTAAVGSTNDLQKALESISALADAVTAIRAKIDEFSGFHEQVERLGQEIQKLKTPPPTRQIAR